MPNANSSSLERAVDFSLPYVVGLETLKNSNVSALTRKPFEIANHEWPFPNDKRREMAGIDYIRNAYFALGGPEGEARAKAEENTMRIMYRAMKDE